MNPPARPLLDIAAGTGLLAALLYAVGWSYALRYFDHFHLGLTQLELPPQHYLMVGFRVLLDYLVWLLPAFFATSLVLMVLRRRRRAWLQRAARHPVLWAVPAVLLLFVAATQRAETGARNDFQAHRAAGFGAYPLTRIWLTPAKTPLDDAAQRIAADLRDGAYRLILETNHTLTLIKPNPSGALPTLQIPRSRVALLRRLPVNRGW